MIHYYQMVRSEHETRFLHHGQTINEKELFARGSSPLPLSLSQMARERGVYEFTCHYVLV